VGGGGRAANVQPIVDHVDDRVARRVGRKAQPVQPGQVARPGGLQAGHVPGHDLSLPLVELLGGKPGLDVEHVGPRGEGGEEPGPQAQGEVHPFEHRFRRAQGGLGQGRDLAHRLLRALVLQDLDHDVDRRVGGQRVEWGGQPVRRPEGAVPLVLDLGLDPAGDLRPRRLVGPDHIAVVGHIGHDPRSGGDQVGLPLVAHRAGELDQVELPPTPRQRGRIDRQRRRVNLCIAQHEPVELRCAVPPSLTALDAATLPGSTSHSENAP